MERYSFKEASFPLDYRAEQVSKIFSVLLHQRSIAVHGLAGMGKSNVIRFMVSHSEAKRHYLGELADRFQFVFLDCNQVDCSNDSVLLEAIDYALAEQGFAISGPEGVGGADTSGQNVPIRLANRFRNLKSDQSVAIFFDCFDQAYANLSSQFFRYLRSLRDSHKNASFVFSSRRAGPDLPELQELFVEPCWVGPFSPPDARASLARDENRLGVTFSEGEKEKMVQVTGGHPGLLKNVAELIGDRLVEPNQEVENFLIQLLQAQRIQYVCQELWNDLSRQEHQALKLLADLVPCAQIDPDILKFFAQAGLTINRAEGKPMLFSPLFEQFVRAQQVQQVLRVTMRSKNNDAQLNSWKGTRVVHLTPNESLLLAYMAKDPRKVFSIDDLINNAWPDVKQAPSSLDALERELNRLSHKVSDIMRQITGDSTYDFVVPVRGRGRNLSLNPHGGWCLEFMVED